MICKQCKQDHSTPYRGRIFCDRSDIEIERDDLKEKLQKCVDHLDMAKEALTGLLSNAAMDWYCEQFARDETPRGMSSGVVSKIHNIELRDRALAAYERARSVLAELKEQGEK